MRSTPEFQGNPAQYVIYANKERQDSLAGLPADKVFTWPPGALHLLGLLQDGFGTRLKALPDGLRLNADRLLMAASTYGALLDKKWALEVAGVGSTAVLLHLIQSAFASTSEWLKGVAYRQTARLTAVPPDIARGIRITLISLFASGRLRRERHATTAHLKRLDQPSAFLSILRLLLWLPWLDIGLNIGVFVCLFLIIPASPLVGLSPVIFPLIVVGLRNFSRVAVPGYLDEFKRLSILETFERVFAPSLRILVIAALVLVAAVKTPLAIAALLSVWTPFALFAARTGEFVSLPWWPLMPVWPVLYIFRNLRKLLITLYRYFIKEILPLLIILIVIAVPLNYFAPTIYDWLNLVWKYLSTNGWWAIGVYGIMLYIMLVLGYWEIRDTIHRYRWLKNHRNGIEVQEFINHLATYTSFNTLTGCVRLVRESNLLVANSEATVLLDDLARLSERTIQDSAKNLRPL